MIRLIRVMGLAFAIAAAATLVVGCGRVDSTATTPYPDKTKVRVAVRPEKEGERIRYVTYPSKDAVIAEQVEIIYFNGNTGYIYYRADGTARQTVEYWPAQEDNPQNRQMKSETKYADDGKTVLADRSFRKDGTKERTGARIADGSYEIYLFHPDGQSVFKHQLVSSAGKALLEEAYWPNGTLKSLSKLKSDNSFETTTYYPSGAKESVTVIGAGYWDPATTELYYEDGKTLRLKVSYGSYQTEATYYRKDGTVSLKTLEYTYGTRAESIVYSRDGTALYKQDWRVERTTNADKSVTKTYLLRAVEELNSDGKTTRRIEFRDDGKTPQSVKLPKPPGSYWGGTEKTFRPDGTLELVVEKDENGKEISRKTHGATEGIREKFKPEYLNRPNAEEPPAPPKRPARPSYPYEFGLF